MDCEVCSVLACTVRKRGPAPEFAFRGLKKSLASITAEQQSDIAVAPGRVRAAREGIAMALRAAFVHSPAPLPRSRNP